MKRFFTALVLVGLVGLMGCQSSGGGASGDQPKASDFKVALLTPGSINDAGWSAIAYAGLKEVEGQMNATVSNEEATGSKIKDSMRSYAQEGYQLVFGHGYEYNAPAMEIAKDFPKTVFVSSSGGQTADNVGAFRFYLEQGFYLAGFVAAKMSKSGVIATVALNGIPSIDSTLKAFEAGAKSVNPKIKVINMKLASDKDTAAAKQSTLEAINQGADFVIHQANAAAQGVFNACKEHPGVYAFGANSDQNANESGVVLASAVIVAKPAFLALAESVKAGTYKGSIQLYGMEKGAVDFVWNPALLKGVSADLQNELGVEMGKIKSGKIVVPKDEF